MSVPSPFYRSAIIDMTARGGAAARPASAAGNKTCQFKLVLLGESAVGKSSLVLRFVKGQFHEYQESTIGAAFLTQTVYLDEATVKFEIWDTAGQGRYHSLAPMYYTGAKTAIIVYDITNQVIASITPGTHNRGCHQSPIERQGKRGGRHGEFHSYLRCR
ncbi:hypothetical protein PRIPAC_78623 [Pristionchus pacificus]|uniref:ADP ribosylation factor n=1 Tax=Pristionchus pacificus TaxID=54126 RepID=A0A2A6C4M3_PRIPA|nr:hypothetical protein PRIPAC_78623 [Pristionchus pacificus]|eukprot:PDM73114.1 ADP ribosylation factor [Pristionchus pacificus]